jgi:hypothetical protein
VNHTQRTPPHALELTCRCGHVVRFSVYRRHVPIVNCRECGSRVFPLGRKASGTRRFNLCGICLEREADWGKVEPGGYIGNNASLKAPTFLCRTCKERLIPIPRMER